MTLEEKINSGVSRNMKSIFNNISSKARGFSLLELLAALVIGTTVLVAAIGVYNRMRASAQTLDRKLAGGLGDEILQRIAEDLDKIVAPVSDSKTANISISIKNKYDQLYHSAQLIITQTYYDSRDKKQTFEQIVWQSNYDYDANGLVLYRSHSGIITEDMLLDSEKENWEKELFIPVAAGLTYFAIEVPKGDDMLTSWSSSSLPVGIVITLSFAEPFKAVDGSLEIEDIDKLSRTVAIDRTRMINFVYVQPEFDQNDFLPDINDLNLPELDIFDENEFDINNLPKR